MLSLKLQADTSKNTSLLSYISIAFVLSLLLDKKQRVSCARPLKLLIVMIYCSGTNEYASQEAMTMGQCWHQPPSWDILGIMTYRLGLLLSNRGIPTQYSIVDTHVMSSTHLTTLNLSGDQGDFDSVNLLAQISPKSLRNQTNRGLTT